VGEWGVTDARLGNAGYSVTVAASAPAVDGSTSAAGSGGSLTLSPDVAAAANNNPPSTGPLPTPAQILSPTAATIENAPLGTGHGQWDFAADSGSAESLGVLIPGNADAGLYTSTLTFTTAPPAS
jgi:WxL domain surface cell wall-binding